MRGGRQHTRQPVGPRGKVGRRTRLPGTEAVDGAARGHDNAQASGGANGLLAGGQDDVEVPVVEAQLLARQAADGIDDDERVRLDAVDDVGDGAHVGAHAGRRVDVGDGDDAVVAAVVEQGVLDLVGPRGGAEALRPQLRRLCPVRRQTVGERVGEVAAVEDEDVLARLGQVGGHLVPAEGAGAGQHERLRAAVARLEQLAELAERGGEGGDEGRADVRLAASSVCRPPLVSAGHT